MTRAAPQPPHRGTPERLVDALAGFALVACGLTAGASTSQSPVVPGVLGVLGAILATFSWNDIGVGCRVERTSVIGATITGVRHIDVARASRVEAYRVGGRWQLRVSGPDGAIAVLARVPLVPELVRAAAVERPSEVAVTRRAMQFLDLPPGLNPRARGGRFMAGTFGAVAAVVAGGFLGAALFYNG